MEFSRRGFLGLFGAGVAGIALDQAIPFNRVWGFPKEIVIARCPREFFFRRILSTKDTIEIELQIQRAYGFDWAFDPPTEITMVEQWHYDRTKKFTCVERRAVTREGEILSLVAQTYPDKLPFVTPKRQASRLSLLPDFEPAS